MDYDDFEDSGYWLSPRNAAALYFAGKLLLQDWTEEDRYSLPVDLHLPEIVSPYRWIPSWRVAYADCIKRVMSRLAKGRFPNPNCTGEEMALHTMIQRAQMFDIDIVQPWYPALCEALNPLLPECSVDCDWDTVKECAFEDHDVLMLFVNPELINNSAIHRQLDMAQLHPEEWFMAFSGRVDDHVL